MKYKIIKQIHSIDELELGGMYVFENTLYVYAGQSPMMSNAYTFMCELGTYYLNKAGLQTIMDNEEFRLVKPMPEK